MSSTRVDARFFDVIPLGAKIVHNAWQIVAYREGRLAVLLTQRSDLLWRILHESAIALERPYGKDSTQDQG